MEVVARFDPLVARTVRSPYYFSYGTHFPLVDNMQPTDEGPIEKPIINWKGGSHMNPAQVHAHCGTQAHRTGMPVFPAQRPMSSGNTQHLGNRNITDFIDKR